MEEVQCATPGTTATPATVVCVFLLLQKTDVVAQDCDALLLLPSGLELIQTDSSLVEMVWMTGPSWFTGLRPLRWQRRPVGKRGEEEKNLRQHGHKLTKRGHKSSQNSIVGCCWMSRFTENHLLLSASRRLEP